MPRNYKPTGFSRGRPASIARLLGLVLPARPQDEGVATASVATDNLSKVHPALSRPLITVRPCPLDEPVYYPLFDRYVNLDD